MRSEFKMSQDLQEGKTESLLSLPALEESPDSLDIF